MPAFIFSFNFIENTLPYLPTLLPNLLLRRNVDMDVGVRCRVGPLGKKMQVDQEKEGRNCHGTCNGLIILTVFVVWQLRIIIEFPIKFYV